MEVECMSRRDSFWEEYIERLIKEMKRNFWQDWEEFKRQYDVTAYPPTTTVMMFVFWQYKKYGRMRGYV